MQVLAQLSCLCNSNRGWMWWCFSHPSLRAWYLQVATRSLKTAGENIIMAIVIIAYLCDHIVIGSWCVCYGDLAWYGWIWVLISFDPADGYIAGCECRGASSTTFGSRRTAYWRRDKIGQKQIISRKVSSTAHVHRCGKHTIARVIDWNWIQWLNPKFVQGFQYYTVFSRY